jgi:hypothetical protein
MVKISAFEIMMSSQLRSEKAGQEAIEGTLYVSRPGFAVCICHGLLFWVRDARPSVAEAPDAA